MSIKKRQSSLKRKTGETDISLSLSLDGSGQAKLKTGMPFLDHMLDLLARHSLFDISATVKGDIEVDFHHSTEDIGIVLGQAFREAVGAGKGITRYASGLIPMDEALCQIAVDISNRPWLSFEANFPKSKVGQFDVELVEEFLRAFTNNARITLHVRLLSGTNLHHMIEAIFKALAIALRRAVAQDPDRKNSIPSTKGSL